MTRADEATSFQPGQSGNPKGSRHRLSEQLLAELCADFEAGGAAAIERCGLERPDVYLRIVASLLPYGATVCIARPSFSEKKRSVLQSACDELIDQGRRIVGCVRPELDEFVQ
jgi:hypothetical protein